MKGFLRQKQVSFTERDVASDEQALDGLQKLGWMTTPVTVIDGQTVVGFDATKLDELLATCP